MSPDALANPRGQSQVLPYLSGLSKKGYIFDLISFEKLDRYQSSKKLIETICDESQIKWHPLKYTKNPPIISTFLDVKKMRQTSMICHSIERSSFSLGQNILYFGHFLSGAEPIDVTQLGVL